MVQFERNFSKMNGSRQNEIMGALFNCKQACMTVWTYSAKLKLLWDELAHYEHLPAYKCEMKTEIIKEKEEIKVHQVLFGLDDTTFGTVRSSILQMDSLPSIKKVYAMITTEEQQKSVAKFSDNRRETTDFATV